jgi:hypothetical protein
MACIPSGRSKTPAHRVAAPAAADFPGARMVDHVLTPRPLNPLCRDVLLLEIRGARYTIRRGVLSDAPALIPAPFGAAAILPSLLIWH